MILRGLPLVSLLVVAVGCGSNVVVGDGGGGTGAGCPGADCDPGCPVDLPVAGEGCDLPDFTECRYTDLDGCTGVMACEPVYPEAGAPSVWVSHGPVDPGCGECFDSSCSDPYIQVPACPNQPGDCYSEIGCDGSTFYCFAADCGAAPTCDPGDTMLAGECPPDALCYSVSICGASVTCIDSSLPGHGCPPAEPAQGSACDVQGPAFCDYPSSPGCFTSYVCDGGAWLAAGGGCEGNP